MNHNNLAQRYLVYKPANKFRWNSVISFEYELCVAVAEETCTPSTLFERTHRSMFTSSALCLLSNCPLEHHFFAFRSGSYVSGLPATLAEGLSVHPL
jgi:hypothetical protein